MYGDRQKPESANNIATELVSRSYCTVEKKFEPTIKNSVHPEDTNMEQEPRKNELMHRFELFLEGKLTHLDYAEREKDVVVFTHTFVPPEFRGQNVAARLTRYALDDARRLGKKVVPQCSYAAVYMERNKEYADLHAGT